MSGFGRPYLDPPAPRRSLYDELHPSGTDAEADEELARLRAPLIPPPDDTVMIDGGDTRLAETMAQAAQADPERQARIYRMKSVTGLPADILDKNLEEVEREAVRQGFDPAAFRRANPLVAQWFDEDPANAALAAKDIDNLSMLERLFGSWGLATGPRPTAIPLPRLERAGDLQTGLAQIEISRIGSRMLRGQATEADRARLRELQAGPARSRYEEWYQATPRSGFEEAAGEAVKQVPNLASTYLHGLRGALGAGTVVGGLASLTGVGAVVGVPATAAAFVTGFRAAAAQAVYDLESGQAMAEYVDGGMDEKTAAAAATAYGLTAMTLELMNLKVVASAVPGLLNRITRQSVRQALVARTRGRAALTFAKDVGKVYASEVGTEFGQETAQIAAGYMGSQIQSGTFQPQSADEVADRLLQTVVQTGKAMLFLGPLAPLAEFTHDWTRANRAERQRESVLAFGETVRASELRKLAPAKFQEFIARAREKGPIENLFVGVREWTRLFQEAGLDPATVAAEATGDMAQYFEALDTGGDLVLPLERAAELAASDHWEALASHVRVHQGDFSVAEAKLWREEATADLDAMFAEGPTPQEEGAPAQSEAIAAFVDNLTDQLEASGIDRSAAAEQAATAGRVFRRLAQRTGMTPEAVMQRFQLRVGSAMTAQADMQRLAQVNRESLDEELDTLAQTIRDETGVARFEPFVTNSGEVHLGNIEVALEHRGSGRGTAAMKRLLAWADQRGLPVTLDPQWNPGKKAALQRFYRRLGFAPASSSRAYHPESSGEWYRAPSGEGPAERLNQTPTGPERVVMAAVRYGSAIGEGPIHQLAHLDLNEKLGAVVPDNSPGLEDGYLTNLGRFLTTDEAAQMAKPGGGSLDATELPGATEALDQVPQTRMDQAEQIPSYVPGQVEPPPMPKPSRTTLAQRPVSDIGHKREKAGRYVGAPDWVETGAHITRLRRILRELARLGEVGRYWYETSAQTVMAFVGGNKAEAEKFVGLLAIFSPNTGVGANTTHAVRAWYQWKAGLPIVAGQFPTDMGAKATAWLERGEDWSGIKTNNFYADLMEEIDPSKVDREHSTMDMWMALAFDYGSNRLDQGPKYGFAQREIARLARELGWRPHQVQAAIWTAIRSRVEGTAKERKVFERKAGILIPGPADKATGRPTEVVAPGREYDHYRAATRFGLAADPSQVDVDNYDFGTALGERSATVSWEATPGVTTGVLPGIHAASLERQQEFLSAIRRALADDQGRDLIDQRLGLLTTDPLQATSGWEGKATASAQQDVAIEKDGTRITARARALINLAADIRGLLLNQEAVAWHYPIYGGPQAMENGVSFRLGRTLTAAETEQLYVALQRELGHSFSPPIPRADGFRVLDFPDERFALEGETDPARRRELQGVLRKKEAAFHDAVLRAVRSLPFHEEVTDAEAFASDGELRSNDWASGDAAYRGRIAAAVAELDAVGTARFAYLQGWIDDDLRPRVQAVHDEFAERYGWDQPGEPAPARGVVAEQRAEYQRAAESAGAEGGAVPAGGGKPRAAVPARRGPPALPAVGGNLATRAELVTTAVRRLPVGRIRTPADAAIAFASLATGAVERVEGIVTDKSGKPLAVVGGFKGAIGEAAFYLPTVLGETYLTPGAAHLWVAHNHPSGVSTPSSADRSVTRHLARAMAGTGVELAGHVVLGQDEFTVIHTNVLQGPESGAITTPAPADGPGVKVPVVERQLVARDQLTRESLTTPDLAMRAADQFAGDESGLLLLDSQSRVIGWYPLDPTALMSLRTLQRAPTLYRMLATANPANAMLVDSTPTGIPRNAVGNLMAFLGGMGVGIYDVFTGPPGRRVSASATGSMVVPPTTFYQDATTEREEMLAQEKLGFISFDPALRGTGSQRRFDVGLLEGANNSTFMHELAHFYLEVLHDVAPPSDLRAAMTSGQSDLAQLYDDLQVIRTWLGAEGDAPITEAQHEQFARGFEVYLLEGKAPSVDLIGPFARFKAWLLLIYKRIEALGVRLTPEVRTTMDRMLASDEAIEQARHITGMRSIFATQESSGMTTAEWMVYRANAARGAEAGAQELLQVLLGEERRDAKEWWKAEQERVRAEVTDELHADPAWQALHYLQRGEMLAGEPLEGEPVKLSKSVLRDRYGEEGLRDLAALRPYVYTDETTGVDPDDVARLFGFENGDALVQAILAKRGQRLRQVIEEQTAQRMEERHPKTVDDSAALARAAMDAAHNDQQAQVLLTELRVLGRQTGSDTRLELETVRALVTQMIGGKRVRDLRPLGYQQAEARAAKAAYEAFGKGDYGVAQAEKRKQLLNHLLYRAALDAQQTAAKVQTYLAKFTTRAVREKLGLAGADYLEQVDALLERFDVAPRTLKAIDKRTGLGEWIAAQEKEGMQVDIPDTMRREAYRESWRNLTYDNLLGLRDTLRTIEHLARLKNTLIAAQKERALNEAAAELGAGIRKHGGPERTSHLGTEERGIGEKAQDAAVAFLARHQRLGSIVRILDGQKDNGPAFRIFLTMINAAQHEEAVRLTTEGHKTDALYEQHYSKEERAAMGRVSPIRELVPGTTLRLTKLTRLMIALNVGTEDNRTKLLDGATRHVPDEETLQRILDTLDERDWKYVQAVWDQVGSYQREIGALQKDLTGLEPKWVEPRPVVTRFGTFRGGYFPLDYNADESEEAYAHTVTAQADLMKQGAAVRARTRDGFTKERVQSTGRPLRLSFGVIYRHQSQVIHYLTHQRMLLDANRLWRHSDVRGAVLDHYGPAVYREVANALTDLAAGSGPTSGAWAQPLAYLRSGSTAALLGWNVVTSALQGFGLSNAIVRIGAKYVAFGLSQWVRSGPAGQQHTLDWIQARSAFMAQRRNNTQRDLAEALRAMRKPSKLNMARAGAYSLIARGQLLSDIPTWLGAFEKAAHEFPDSSEAERVALADQAVKDSQGGGLLVDQAGIERGNAVEKLLTTFMSYGITVLQQNVELAKRTKWTSPASVAAGLVDGLLLNVVPVVLAGILRAAMRGEPPEPTDVARDLVASIFNMFIGVRELAGWVQTGQAGGPAGLRIIPATENLIAQAAQLEADAAFWRALNMEAGILFHYPALQLQRTVEGTNAILSGETINPLVLVGGPPRSLQRAR